MQHSACIRTCNVGAALTILALYGDILINKSIHSPKADVYVPYLWSIYITTELQRDNLAIDHASPQERCTFVPVLQPRW